MKPPLRARPAQRVLSTLSRRMEGYLRLGGAIVVDHSAGR